VLKLLKLSIDETEFDEENVQTDEHESKNHFKIQVCMLLKLRFEIRQFNLT
jgi:hypothetical protein